MGEVGGWVGSLAGAGGGGLAVRARAGSVAPAAGIGAKIADQVLPAVRKLCHDSMDPVENVQVALGLAGCGIGRGVDADHGVVVELESVEPQRGAGDVAGETLETRSVFSRDQLSGVHGEPRGLPEEETLDKTRGSLSA